MIDVQALKRSRTQPAGQRRSERRVLGRLVVARESRTEQVGCWWCFWCIGRQAAVRDGCCRSPLARNRRQAVTPAWTNSPHRPLCIMFTPGPISFCGNGIKMAGHEGLCERLLRLRWDKSTHTLASLVYFQRTCSVPRYPVHEPTVARRPCIAKLGVLGAISGHGERGSVHTDFGQSPRP